ncbi:MAG: hypothetical protein PHI68_07950 [Candidatus Cloacimonetes bacterium]|nr:hypothetical protein [Candidatus Cloacimonadota bacterium]
MKLLILLCLAALILCSCGGFNLQNRRQIDSITPVESFRIEDPITKILYEPMSKITYALNPSWQEISFFQTEKRINKTGGLGFENAKFRKLSDIALDTDGALLALDSSARLIKKFSTEGKYLGEYELAEATQPELFCLAEDQTVFVYDAIAAEIICYSPLNMKTQYRFGKFQLAQITSLSCTRDFILAQSLPLGRTDIFSSLGQLLYSLPHLAVMDRFGNLLYLEGGILKALPFQPKEQDLVEARALTMIGNSQVESFGMEADTISCLQAGQVTHYKILYLGKEDQ